MLCNLLGQKCGEAEASSTVALYAAEMRCMWFIFLLIDNFEVSHVAREQISSFLHGRQAKVLDMRTLTPGGVAEGQRRSRQVTRSLAKYSL